MIMRSTLTDGVSSLTSYKLYHSMSLNILAFMAYLYMMLPYNASMDSIYTTYLYHAHNKAFKHMTLHMF